MNSNFDFTLLILHSVVSFFIVFFPFPFHCFSVFRWHVRNYASNVAFEMHCGALHLVDYWTNSMNSGTVSFRSNNVTINELLLRHNKHLCRRYRLHWHGHVVRCTQHVCNLLHFTEWPIRNFAIVPNFKQNKAPNQKAIKCIYWMLHRIRALNRRPRHTLHCYTRKLILKYNGILFHHIHHENNE